jgi:hypothetical protein
MTCGCCKIWRFAGTYRLHHLGEKNHKARNNVSRNATRMLFSGMWGRVAVLRTDVSDEYIAPIIRVNNNQRGRNHVNSDESYTLKLHFMLPETRIPLLTQDCSLNRRNDGQISFRESFNLRQYTALNYLMKYPHIKLPVLTDKVLQFFEA